MYLSMFCYCALDVLSVTHVAITAKHTSYPLLCDVLTLCTHLTIYIRGFKPHEAEQISSQNISS